MHPNSKLMWKPVLATERREISEESQVFCLLWQLLLQVQPSSLMAYFTLTQVREAVTVVLVFVTHAHGLTEDRVYVPQP